jgi:hypothetical protein
VSPLVTVAEIAANRPSQLSGPLLLASASVRSTTPEAWRCLRTGPCGPRPNKRYLRTPRTPPDADWQARGLDETRRLRCIGAPHRIPVRLPGGTRNDVHESVLPSRCCLTDCAVSDCSSLPDQLGNTRLDLTGRRTQVSWSMPQSYGERSMRHLTNAAGEARPSPCIQVTNVGFADQFRRHPAPRRYCIVLPARRNRRLFGICEIEDPTERLGDLGWNRPGDCKVVLGPSCHV